MSHLLDVNSLVALFDPRHVNYAAAQHRVSLTLADARSEGVLVDESRSRSIRTVSSRAVRRSGPRAARSCYNSHDAAARSDHSGPAQRPAASTSLFCIAANVAAANKWH